MKRENWIKLFVIWFVFPLFLSIVQGEPELTMSGFLFLLLTFPIVCVLLFVGKKIFLWSIPHKVWGSFF